MLHDVARAVGSALRPWQTAFERCFLQLNVPCLQVIHTRFHRCVLRLQLLQLLSNSTEYRLQHCVEHCERKWSLPIPLQERGHSRLDFGVRLAHRCCLAKYSARSRSVTAFASRTTRGRCASTSANGTPCNVAFWSWARTIRRSRSAICSRPTSTTGLRFLDIICAADIPSRAVTAAGPVHK